MKTDDIKWWEEQPKLWKKLVPSSGKAETLQGELIRCTGKLTDETYRNGNMNWESGYEKLAKFISEHLSDPNTFSEDEIQKIRDSVNSIIRDFDTPDTSGHGGPHYYLTEMAVRWCLINQSPISYEQDSGIKI